MPSPPPMSSLNNPPAPASVPASGTSDPRSAWPDEPAPASNPVPPGYLGVWSRSLLETPEQRDTSTFVRWMQLGRWHADLRVPASAGEPCQGFSGITRVTRSEGRDICRWQRMVDYSPPRGTVDEGWVDFIHSEQLVETGIHATYHEVWDLLPGSLGQRIALAESKPAAPAQARIFVAGQWLMRVRPCTPESAVFEISFGLWIDGAWHIEQSTIAALRGQSIAISFVQQSSSVARVAIEGVSGEWQILEWAED